MVHGSDPSQHDGLEETGWKHVASTQHSFRDPGRLCTLNCTSWLRVMCGHSAQGSTVSLSPLLTPGSQHSPLDGRVHGLALDTFIGVDP